jgi:hypothetical protein
LSCNVSKRVTTAPSGACTVNRNGCATPAANADDPTTNPYDPPPACTFAAAGGGEKDGDEEDDFPMKYPPIRAISTDTANTAPRRATGSAGSTLT